MSDTSVNEPSGKKDVTSKPYEADEVFHVEDIKTTGAEAEFDNSIDDTRSSKAVWLIVLTVAMGGFLFGKDPEAGYEMIHH